jgi:hypothetical protein
MNTELVFGEKIFSSHCTDENLYKNETLSNSIETIYKGSDINHSVEEQKGNALTTIGTEINLLELPGMKDLVNWMLSQVELVAKELGILNTQCYIGRLWSNRMFKGCESLCHLHMVPNINGVGIFYYQVPKDSAQLVLINGGIPGTEFHHYPKNKQHYIKPVEGQLIIHPPNIPHAVSTHNSDDPRTCFVFEFHFKG